ncbi:MAG TPA: hypothetical protein VJ933_09830, partial [Phaeodactylibacter sp.]|nr:hypothetical protein [Phaeodactylibacter sp.]
MITEHKKWLVWATFPDRSQLVWKWNWVYMQSGYQKWMPLFIRQEFYTKVVDLTTTKDSMYQSLPPASQYEIRRARKDELTMHYHTDVGVIIRLFSPTAEAKQLNSIGLSTFHTKSDYLVSEIRSPQYGAVAAHFYQLDEQSRRVHLTYNCSAYRLYQDKSIRSLCGRANRLLFLE